MIVACKLLAWVLGGIAFGIVADRTGRSKNGERGLLPDSSALAPEGQRTKTRSRWVMSPPSEARSAATIRPRRPPQLRVNGQAHSIATICCTCSQQKVARRVGWPTEAFGSIRPSTHIFEPKGDSLPIDPAIHTDIEVGGSHPPDSVHWMSAIEGLLQVTADSSLWSTPHGLEVAKD